MYKDLKWLRLTPDRPGRGGTKTGIHTFQQEPVNDVRSLTGGHVYQGTWRREFAGDIYPVPQGLPVVGSAPLALHGYVYPSLTDPSAVPTVNVLSHQIEATPSVNTWVREASTGTARIGPRSPTAPPAIFQNISGRCFVAEGTGEGVILDDRTPAIHAQPNQPLGIGTPQQPLPNTGGNLTPDGTGYLHVASPYINHPNPDNQLGTILAADTSVTPSIIDPLYVGIYAGAVMAPAVATVDAVTSNTTPFTPPGTGISIVTGTSLVTLVGGVWPANYKFAGLSINFNGFSFVVLSHGALGIGTGLDLQGNAIALSNVQLLILGVYDGPTLVNVPYTITGCQVTMPANSTLTTVNTNIAATPPGVAQGYSQMTASNLVQIKVRVLRANGLYRNLGNISLGPVGGGTRDTSTLARMNAGLQGIFFSPGGVGGSPLVSADVQKTIIVDLAGVAAIMLVTVITSVDPPNGGFLATAATGGVGPVRAWWGDDFVGTQDAAMAIASTTLTSASNPFFLDDVGKTIMVAGAGGVGAPGPALFTQIAAYVNPGQVTLALANASGAPIAGAQAYWGSGTSNTHAGPTYAYAWYDPETGACSNISPLYQVPKPTTQGNYADFANLTPVFQIDTGSIAYPNQATDGIRFSHILFFRTLSTAGSSTLYPIGSLNPFFGKVHPGSASTRGSWNPSPFHGWMGLPNNYTAAPPVVAAPNYWYDWSSDSDLLLSGGFRAPQETNEKPMVLLRGGATQAAYPFAMQYWDRRLWIIPTQDPFRLMFSCDEAQCPLGVPTESFPPTNGLDISSEDGAGVALKVVGDMLLLTTQRRAYVIAGNNESNYRLMKISSAMAGVGYYQMDEFPTYTGAEGEPSTLFYLGRDRKVYEWTVGTNVVPISQPVQDQLDTVLSGHGLFTSLLEYQFSRVHCVSAWGRRLVIVAPNGIIETPSLGPSQVHFYDIDNRVWSEGFHPNFSQHAQDGLAPMATVYGGDVPTNEIFSVYDPALNRIVVQSWIRDDTSGTPNYMTITTFPINFDGKKTRKQIVAMNLHATAGSWTGGMFVNEATASIAATFGPYPDPLESIYAPAATPADPSAQDIVVMAGQFSNQAPVVGYRFSFVVQKNADQNPAKVYALDVGFVDYEEPGDGDP